ncbi:MAG: biotin--[acetyl-CoA-carboxylase] ligase, partial [Clostridiales bacterium]|nr:biotin--[acetyl-CoA-carboxylase] ligase [Clostridiales bacterium]
NQTAKDFSEETLPYATSLAIELGKNFSIPQTRDRLIQAFDDTLSLFIQRGFEPLREEYQAKLINTGKEVRVIYQKQEVVATAIGILENGNLLCQKDGKTFSVNSGEASVRGLYGYV